LIPWALHYTLAGTPVRVGDFVRTVRRPLLAALIMAGGLLLLRSSMSLESAALELALGCIASPALYVVSFQLLPGERRELQSVLAELRSTLRRRSSVRVKASNDAT
jgi:hypothetical protein